ncbi:dihydrofolate reductase family protein [Mucilaginibacter agri]|uniref:Dihydrofolate reductase n=1 Tax=Mucilaginibacter agri TaxID=2695265 RepID=A0A966DS12_9SPHI|nr:dihydrofolate reductase family protein [Mucilaginibacter agri]NCD69653.1 dihydrofolate reductase [Mucilaginibacter agri]
MIADEFKITIHMVMSLDGIIAKPDNSIAWFDTPDRYENGVNITDSERVEFLKAIDCYVMGAATYELALELSKNYGWAYGDKPTIVLTHRDLPVERQSVEIYSGDLNQLVNNRLKPHYKNVWLVGGAELAKDFINLKLADEIRVSIIPVILGEGLRLFKQIEHDQPLHLKNVTPYKNGMVELIYEIKNS